MKTTTIICATCGQSSEKRTTEIKRQQKKGRNEFFCSLKCYGNHPKTTKRIIENRSVYKISKHSNNRTDEFTPFRTHLRRAKRRDKECNISLQDLKEAWTGRCVLTGLPIVLPDERGISDPRKTASLDRIDSSKGYVKGNIQWVSIIINNAKNTLSNEEVKEWLNEITNA